MLKNLLIVQSPSSSLVCDMLNVCKDEIVIDACVRHQVEKLDAY